MVAAVADQDKDLAMRTKRRYDQLCRRRDGWRSFFATIARFILMKPIWFGDTGVPMRTPRLSVREVSDDTAIDAARTAAMTFGGALWPNTAETFEIVPCLNGSVDQDYRAAFETQEVKDYFSQVTTNVRHAIDAPEARFLLSWNEYLDGQMSYGTSGIFGTENEDDDHCPFYFKSLGVETSVIDENEKGAVDTICQEFDFTVRQVVEKYGIDLVSKRTRDLYNSDKDDTFIKVIQLVQPRKSGTVGAEKNKKPIASIHMEVDTAHILIDDGMDHMCGWMVRFRKLTNELYARSLAMDAIPTIKELNVLRTYFNQALQKILKPPMGYYNDQIGGAASLDLSPGAKVPLYYTGRLAQGQLPVIPLMQLSEPQVAQQRLLELEDIVKQKFLIDKLLDFNSDQRMTATETMERSDFRSQALGNYFSRQMIELLHPMIHWCFMIMWKRRLLGYDPIIDQAKIAQLQGNGQNPLVVPQVVAELVNKGKPPFMVRFISPAARAMRADALKGLERFTTFVINASQMVPEMRDNLDPDEIVYLHQDLSGAPRKAIRGKDQVKKNRDMLNKQRQSQAQVQGDTAQAHIAATAAKAVKEVSQAGIPGAAGKALNLLAPMQGPMGGPNGQQ